MSVAIVFNQKDTQDWFLKLSELFPETSVEVYPNIKDKEKIEFLVTWKPHVNYSNEFPNLKVVHSVGAGVDNLLHTKLPNSVSVARIVDQNLKQDMFEHALACVFNSMKNLNLYNNLKQVKIWNSDSYKSINDTTITILGLGEIGSFVAEKLVALGFKVKGWSKHLKYLDKIECYDESNLSQAVAHSDYIINILPLTSETESILNFTFFELLSKNTTIINIGRGAHLNDSDLMLALDHGIVKEAYLDVFNVEPLPIDHPFWNHPSVFVTPHIAAITNPNSAIFQVVDNFKRFQNNEPLLHQVDLNKEY